MKFVFGTLLLLLSVPAYAVTVTIAVEPERQLVGLCPALRIWLRNDGNTPVEIPKDAALQVVPARGEPFVAHYGLRIMERDYILSIDEHPFILGPGETRDLSRGGYGQHWLSSDDRFDTPGTFRLQLVIAGGFDFEKLKGVNSAVSQPGLLQPLVSNVTTYTVIEPTGSELEAWNLINEKGVSDYENRDTILWERHPDSAYAPWFIPDSGPDRLKRIAALEAGIAKHPPQHHVDALQLRLAENWQRRGDELDTLDVDEAMAAYGRAEDLLRRLSDHAISRLDSETARELLAHLPTREQVVRRYNEAHGILEKTVLIEPGCYEKLPDRQYKVWWSYDNLYNQPLEIPIGPENKFTPPPFDRKQPTTFPDEQVMYAFSVVTREPVLTWHLQKKTTQFKVSEGIECPAWFDPKDSRTWTLERPDHLDEPPPD